IISTFIFNNLADSFIYLSRSLAQTSLNHGECGEFRCKDRAIAERGEADAPRRQLKQAVTAMVQQAMQYIDETPDVETRIERIKTLNSVSAGKIYVEIERA
ncbi:hypothetical protein RYX36_026062, partial [Vicia faba]